MFERLDQARSLTTNQLKIIAAAVITPKATLDAIVPSLLYFTGWMALCGFAFLLFDFETGRTWIAAIDQRFEDGPPAAAGAGGRK